MKVNNRKKDPTGTAQLKQIRSHFPTFLCYITDVKLYSTGKQKQILDYHCFILNSLSLSFKTQIISA